jgi:hypothetical protein
MSVFVVYFVIDSVRELLHMRMITRIVENYLSYDYFQILFVRISETSEMSFSNLRKMLSTAVRLWCIV